jgi:DNA polymerase III delta subunit
MAIPNPEEELTRLQKLLARGLPPVVVVTGNNDHFRAEATDLLLAAVPKAAELRTIDAVDERGGGGGDDDAAGDDDDAGDAVPEGAGLAACPELQDLLGGGLFARTAFVVVRRGSGWWKQHAATLAGVAPRLLKGCGLVLEAKKLDKRKKVAQSLVKSLTESGALFEFRDLYDLPYDRSRSPLEGELCKWVVARSRQLGIALQPDAAWLLVMQVGKTPVDLLAELGRLRDQFGGDPKRKPLAPNELRGKLTCSFESTPFELAEAVLGGDRKAAFRSVRAMFERGVRGKDGKAMDTGGLLPFTTSWLFQQLASAWQGRQALDQGTPVRELAALVGVRQFADRFVDHVQKHDLARLTRGLQALHACQRASRLTGEEPDALLERFLAQWFDGAPIPSLQDLEA